MLSRDLSLMSATSRLQHQASRTKASVTVFLILDSFCPGHLADLCLVVNES